MGALVKTDLLVEQKQLCANFLKALSKEAHITTAIGNDSVIVLNDNAEGFKACLIVNDQGKAVIDIKKHEFVERDLLDGLVRIRYELLRHCHPQNFESNFS